MRHNLWCGLTLFLYKAWKFTLEKARQIMKKSLTLVSNKWVECNIFLGAFTSPCPLLSHSKDHALLRTQNHNSHGCIRIEAGIWILPLLFFLPCIHCSILNLSTTEEWINLLDLGLDNSVLGGCPVHCGVLVLHPLDAGSTLPPSLIVTAKNFSWWEMSSGTHSWELLLTSRPFCRRLYLPAAPISKYETLAGPQLSWQ